MKKMNRKGFTIVELVIVIAIVAVLAAVLIPTFAGLIKKADESAYLQDRTNQQIADMAEKLATQNENYLTWEDFEAKLAEQLAKQEGVSEEDMKAAITNALAEYMRANENKDTALTEDQVKAIVEKALQGQLTTAQVEAIVNAANKDNLTTEQVQQIVNAAVSDLQNKVGNVGITKEQMEKAIKDAVENIDGVNKTELNAAIEAAIAKLGNSALTAEKIQEIINAAVGNAPSTADQMAVNEMNVILANAQATESLIVAGNDAQTSINIFNTLVANGYSYEIDAYHGNYSFGYVVESGKAVIVLVENNAIAFPQNYIGTPHKQFFEAVDNAEELEAAFETGYVLLKTDAVFTETIGITNDVTIVGNNKILNDAHLTGDSAANSAVNINNATEDINVNMSGISISNPDDTYARGLNLSNNTGKVTMVLENVNIDSHYYAFNITKSNSGGVEIVIRNSTISGWAALNVWSKCNISFENCTLIGNAKSTESFGAIVINTDAAGSNFTFKNCTIEANNVSEGSGMKMVNVRCDATLTFEGCTFKVNGQTVSELTQSVKPGVTATITVK